MMKLEDLSVEAQKKIEYFQREIVRYEAIFTRENELVTVFRHRFEASNNRNDYAMMAAHEGNLEGIRERISSCKRGIDDVIEREQKSQMELQIVQIPFVPVSDNNVTRLLESKKRLQEMVERMQIPHYFHGNNGLASIVVLLPKRQISEWRSIVFENAGGSFLHDNYNVFDLLSSYGSHRSFMTPIGLLLHDEVMSDYTFTMVPSGTSLEEDSDGVLMIEGMRVLGMMHPFVTLLYKNQENGVFKFMADIQESKDARLPNEYNYDF